MNYHYIQSVGFVYVDRRSLRSLLETLEQGEDWLDRIQNWAYTDYHVDYYDDFVHWYAYLDDDPHREYEYLDRFWYLF